MTSRSGAPPELRLKWSPGIQVASRTLAIAGPPQPIKPGLTCGIFWQSLTRNQLFLRKQSDLHGKAHQAWNIMNLQAVHQLHAMVFDGLGADLQDLGYLFGVLAFGDELENLALTPRQLVEWAFPVSKRFQGKFFEKSRGDFLTQINFRANHPLQDRLDLLGSRLGLLSSGFGLLNPRFAAGYFRRLIDFFHFASVTLSRETLLLPRGIYPCPDFNTRSTTEKPDATALFIERHTTSHFLFRSSRFAR
jgi:hypothetical protein